MRKNKPAVETEKERSRRGRVWLWLFAAVLVVAGVAVWFTYDKGLVNWGYVANKIVPSDAVVQVVDVPVVEEKTGEQISVVESEPVEAEIQPACAVVEEILLQYIAPDNSSDYMKQAESAKIYSVLAKYGCPENSTFFTDMAARKQVIADGLEAVYMPNMDTMSSVEYLYSDEKICQTIENRVMKNINPNAYTYKEFLDNAQTYSVLYEYGCKDNKYAYMRAAVRELGVAVALMPTDKMERDEIITVVEICKSLGVAEAAHLMLQRLKARGYDMEFILEMEDIIHGIR